MIQVDEGNVTIEVRCARTKRVLRRTRIRNKVVNNGLAAVSDLLGGTGFAPDKMAVGTGTVATQDADLQLGAEVFKKDLDRRIKGTNKVTYQMLLTSVDANGNTLSEAGLFEQTTMYARVLITPVIVKTALIEATISHEFTVARKA